MTFSVDDRVLIKMLRHEKWYGANSPDLNPVDLGEAAGTCVSCTAGFMTLTSWSYPWSKSAWEYFYRAGVCRWNDQAMAVRGE